MSRPRSVWSELRHWLILWHRVSCVKIDFMVPREALQKRFAMAKEVVRTSSWLAWFLVDVWANSIFFCHSCSFTHTLSSSQKGEPAQFFYGLRRKIFRKNRTGVNTRQHFHVCCAHRHPLRALCEPPGGFEEPRKSPLSWKLICHAACPRQGTAPQTPPDTLILT